MFSSFTIIAVICAYLGFLLLGAELTERLYRRGKSLSDNAVVYGLAMAVYCTAWTYYGSVGKAATAGFIFLTIYLGPTMAIAVWPTILKKIIRIKKAHRITSIADLISARYDRSRSLAALVSFIALVGVTPYMALQFRSINFSLSIITGSAQQPEYWIGDLRTGLVAILLIVFTIVLGMRRLDPTESHPGMMVILALESIVKLVAFLAAGIFVTYFMYDGFADIFERAARDLQTMAPAHHPATAAAPLTWTGYLMLAMLAHLCLPRQFHVTVVENRDEKHVNTAMWLFPLYMLAISVFVFPVAMGGLLASDTPSRPDTFLLALPLQEGRKWLSLLVFLGGFSAAMGMIMVSSITVATMITNHLLLPVIGWIKWLGFLRRRLLLCRWITVAAIIGIGWLSETQVGRPYMLVNIGLISFAAALQFAPAVFGGLFWRRGAKRGAQLGMIAGFIVWAYTLIMPAFARSGLFPIDVVVNGPWGLGFLRPEQLFGVDLADPVTHSVFWSMLVNTGLYISGSLYFTQSETEQRRAEEFVGIQDNETDHRPKMKTAAHIPLRVKLQIIEDLFLVYFSAERAAELTRQCVYSVELEKRDRISIGELAELSGEVERVLGGSMGVAEAKQALKGQDLFTPREAEELSEYYAAVLAELRVSPEELKRRIDYYKDRETLLEMHASELEDKVIERTRDLEQAQHELLKREKLSVLGQLTAFVSHELRNPLAVIKSSSYYLRQKLDDADSKVAKHVQRIEEQVSRCNTIIVELLQYTRGSPSHITPGELNPWLEKVLDDVGPPPPGVTLVRDLAPALPIVKFDRVKLQSVVLNLIENSLHAVTEKMIACSNENRSYDPMIKVSTRPIGAGLKLEVSDNGIGMDVETSQRSFEPLFTTKARGTGLGLSIVRKIAEEHGAEVILNGEPFQGATVSIILGNQVSLDGDSTDVVSSERKPTVG